jgi:hypothetical protein
MNDDFESPLMAVVMNMRLSQTTGLECAKPGSRLFHKILTDFSPSHLRGVGTDVDTPEALGPRNCGQFSPRAEATKHRHRQTDRRRFIKATSKNGINGSASSALILEARDYFSTLSNLKV